MYKRQVLFLVCAVLCVIVYMALTKEDDGLSKAERKARRQMCIRDSYKVNRKC